MRSFTLRLPKIPGTNWRQTTGRTTINLQKSNFSFGYLNLRWLLSVLSSRLTRPCRWNQILRDDITMHTITYALTGKCFFIYYPTKHDFELLKTEDVVSTLLGCLIRVSLNSKKGTSSKWHKHKFSVDHFSSPFYVYGKHLLTKSSLNDVAFLFLTSFRQTKQNNHEEYILLRLTDFR